MDLRKTSPIDPFDHVRLVQRAREMQAEAVAMLARRAATWMRERLGTARAAESRSAHAA